MDRSIWRNLRNGANQALYRQLQDNPSLPLILNTHHPESGMTMLMLAVQKRNIDIISLLIERGADVNVADMTVYGNTAMHYAADTNFIPCIILLQKANADIYALNRANYAPIDIARYNSRNATAHYLNAETQIHASYLYVRHYTLIKDRSSNTAPSSNQTHLSHDTAPFSKQDPHSLDTTPSSNQTHTSPNTTPCSNQNHSSPNTTPSFNHIPPSPNTTPSFNRTHPPPNTAPSSTTAHFSIRSAWRSWRKRYCVITARNRDQTSFQIAIFTHPQSITPVSVISLYSGSYSTLTCEKSNPSKLMKYFERDHSFHFDRPLPIQSTRSCIFKSSAMQPRYSDLCRHTNRLLFAAISANERSKWLYALSRQSSHAQMNPSAPILDACLFCMQNKRDTACVPCGHVIGCFACLSKCTAQSAQCVICREPLKSILNLYFC